MKRILFTLIIMMIGLHASSQYVGWWKSILREDMKRIIKKNSYKNSFIVETDSFLLLSLKDSTVVVPVDFYYHFNKSNTCDMAKTINHCSFCLSKFWDGILSNSKYKWQKNNANKYLSKFSKKRMIEIIDAKISCPYIKMTRVKWSRSEYNALLKEIS